MIEYYLKALLYDYKVAKEKGQDVDQIVKKLVRDYIKRPAKFSLDISQLDFKDVERLSYLILLMSLYMEGRSKKEKDIIKALLKEVEKG